MLQLNCVCVCVTLLLSDCLYAQVITKNSGNLQIANYSHNADAIRGITDVVDAVYNAYAKKIKTPGMAYGVISNGKFVHKGFIGNANIEKQIKVNDTTAFRIASMTKSFVALAILQLRDQGRLRLDDPAHLYIPELQSQQYPSTDAPPITIRNLMTHSAGFPEDNPWGDRQLAISEDEMIAMFKRGISFSTTPQVEYEYSNMGFAMLGLIVRKVSGLTYEKYIDSNILKPLGMNHTYWEYDKVPERNLAKGYRFINGKWVSQPLLHAGAYGAMGGLITTLDDFAKYASLHLSAWPPSDRAESPVLKRSSLREMHQAWQFINLDAGYAYPGGRRCATSSGYGYGLHALRDCDDRKFIGHSGGLPGFGSNWMILPQYGVGLVCFANVTYAPASRINMHVADTIINTAKLNRSKIPVTPILEQRKNELLEIIKSWDTTGRTGIFAENFFLDYFPDSLKKQSASMFQKSGEIVRVHELLAENNLRGTFVIEGTKSDLQVKFTLTPENPPLIQEYRISAIPQVKKTTPTSGRKVDLSVR